jgi:bacterial leucyl aminopeptidase
MLTHRNKLKISFIVLFFIFSYSVFANQNKIINFSKKHEYRIQYKNDVTYLLNQVISPETMLNNLAKLVVYPDRGSEHESGKNAAYWIRDQLEIMKRQSGRADVNIYEVETKWKYPDGYLAERIQPSVVLSIGASSIEHPEPAIIIGAHLDSKSCMFENCIDDEGNDDSKHGAGGPFPGADDDGSGVVTVMEVARTLLSSNLQFKKPIYLVWYAAEEAGTLGSYSVVDDFKKKNISIEAVLQLDMTGYTVNNDLTMWLSTCNNLDKNLTDYLENLIDIYIPKRFVRRISECDTNSYSDDRAWVESGFTVARPLESNDSNPYMHTNQDTLDKVSLVHMTDYLKLAIAFVVELAEPKKA